ncbi:hypothetical protein N7501_003501, partial [Penicillium viridicatum]
MIRFFPLRVLTLYISLSFSLSLSLPFSTLIFTLEFSSYSVIATLRALNPPAWPSRSLL